VSDELATVLAAVFFGVLVLVVSIVAASGA
jgi:hypothetical protein